MENEQPLDEYPGLEQREVRTNKHFIDQVQTTCTAKSIDTFFKALIGMLGSPRSVIGTAVEYDTNSGQPTRIVATPHDILQAIMLRNEYAKSGKWYFLGKGLKLSDDMSAALAALWLRAPKNTIYTVADAYSFTAVETSILQAGSHNEGNWTERVMGFRIEPVRVPNPGLLTLINLVNE